jgi:hypothetical protein
MSDAELKWNGHQTILWIISDWVLHNLIDKEFSTIRIQLENKYN